MTTEDRLIEHVIAQLRTVPVLAQLVLPYPNAYTGVDTLPVGAKQIDQIARLIDHTLLKPEATPQQIEQLCEQARRYQFASVCVNADYVARCAELLAGSGVAVCSVVGFPLGATTTATKVFEARQVCHTGGSEVDMVLAIGRLVADEYAAVYADIQQVVAACHDEGALCKVIIETALLTDAHKIAACLLAVAAGADFVKTSTGFGGGGATPTDVALMRRTVGPSPGVKASGGIRTLDDVQALLAAGATRIGTSAGVTLLHVPGNKPSYS